MATITVFPENQLLEKSVSEILKAQRQIHDDYLIIDVNLYCIRDLVVDLFDYIDTNFSSFSGIMLVLYDKNSEMLANYICAHYAQQMNIVLMNSREQLNDIIERIYCPYAALNTAFRSTLTSMDFHWLKLFYGAFSINEIAESTSRSTTALYATRSALVRKVFGNTVRNSKRLWPPLVL